MAMDEYIAEYTLHHFKEQLKNIRKHHDLRLEGNSYGVITENRGMKEMLVSFFKTNEDNRRLMLHEVVQQNYVSLIFDINNNHITKGNKNSII